MLMSRPLPRPLVEADMRFVEVVFTDVDGTLTTDDRIESTTLEAFERLQAAGVKVVLVSGRPAGWGECWARQWPVDGVIVENGGLHFARRASGALVKTYAQPEEERLEGRRRLISALPEVLRQVPGARLSSDSAYTEVDIAIDYNEEVRLGEEAAQTLERLMRERGFSAVRSSVHVNCWAGHFDKRTAVERFLSVEWGVALLARDARFVYVGDSLNDAPLFQAFEASVGVANVESVLGVIDCPPKFMTTAREGAGFREVVEHVLSSRERGLSQ